MTFSQKNKKKSHISVLLAACLGFSQAALELLNLLLRLAKILLEFHLGRHSFGEILFERVHLGLLHPESVVKDNEGFLLLIQVLGQALGDLQEIGVLLFHLLNAILER